MRTNNLDWTAQDGAALKAERERAGLTQKGLAEQIGKSASYVSELERGDHAPAPECYDKLTAQGFVEEGVTPVAPVDPENNTAEPEAPTSRVRRENRAILRSVAERKPGETDEDVKDRERREKAYNEARDKANHCADCGTLLYDVARGRMAVDHYHQRVSDRFPFVVNICCACNKKAPAK